MSDMNGRPQVVRLFADKDERQMITQIRWPWEREWPPPEVLLLATRPDGEITVTLVETAQTLQETNPELAAKVTLQRFVRSTYSKMTVEYLELATHLTRGASYVPEEA